jgi:site-specific recombinase XerD
MTDSEAIYAFLGYLHARNYSTSTVKLRAVGLRSLVRFMAPQSIFTAGEDDVVEWLARHAKPETKHAYLSATRQFYRWAVRRGVTTVNPVADIESVRRPAHLPRPVARDELAAAVTAAAGHVQLALLLGALAGLRCAEVAALHTDDIHLDAPTPMLIVRQGKGGKDRVVPLHPELVARLRRVPLGWIFPNGDGGHVRSDTVGAWAKDAFRAVESTATMHMTRHLFGTEAARIAHGNLLLIGALMGHASPATTAGYTALDPTEGADVVAAIAYDGPVDELTRRRRARTVG